METLLKEVNLQKRGNQQILADSMEEIRKEVGLKGNYQLPCNSNNKLLLEIKHPTLPMVEAFQIVRFLKAIEEQLLDNHSVCPATQVGKTTSL